METFGEYLKVHREKKGIRLEEIASITKIHLRSLEMLEASQWTDLPPEPFIRGFIIAYAKYVGLDTKDVLERYFSETGQRAATSAVNVVTTDPLPQPPSQLASDVIEQGRPLPTGPVFAAAGILAALAIIGSVVYIGKRSVGPIETAATAATTTSPETAKADPADNRNVASPNGTTGTTAAKTEPAKTDATAPIPPPSAAAAALAHEIVIDAKDRTWARVIIDDEAPQKFYLREGEKVTYSAKEKLKVVLGNGTNARVLYNGKLVYGFKAGEMLRAYRFPSGAKFPQDNAARREAAARSEGDKSETPEEAPKNDQPAVIHSPGE